MKTTTRHLPHLLFLVLLCPHTYAQTTTNILHPETIVQLALTYNPFLKARTETLHMASAQKRQADAAFIPRLDARAQAQHFEGLENGSIAPTVTLPVMEDQYTASIGITQPLYTGGRITQQRRSAVFQEEAAQHSVHASAADIELQTLSTYWQWSKAVAQITALQASVARMEAQLTDTKNLKNAGLATDNDLLASEVILDQIQLQLQSAQQQAELGRIQLTQLTGQPLPPQAVPCSPTTSARVTVPSLYEALNTALSNRPELASLRLNAQASAALIGVAQSEGRPQLSLQARYEQGNPNPRDFPPEEQWRDDAFIGAALTWNLFDGGLTRAHTTEAKAKAARDAYQLQSACDTILAETKAAILAINYSLARLTTSKHAETSATRNLQVATDLWKNGTARNSDVLEAQTKLTLTTAQRIAAEADVLIAEATVKHAICWRP